MGVTKISLGSQETLTLLLGIHTDIPGCTQKPKLFSSGFRRISLGAHSNPISFLWDSHRYPWAHTATRSLSFGIHTDIPRRTQQPDLFSLGFTQISLGAHSNPISFLWDSHRYPWAHTATQSLFFFLFFWDSHRYPWAHTATRSLFFGIHTDIPGRTQKPDLFPLGFTQISLGAHSNPISFLWDSHRYPWAHTATRSLFFGIHTDIPGRTQQPNLFFFSFFFGIHTDIPGRTQQPDLFSLGFTQISLGAHRNPISFLWDSHRYPWAHTATRSLFFGIHTDIPGRTQQPNLSLLFFFFFFFSSLFFWGFTQISLGAHSNPISFLWDSHRYPWAHTATQSLFFFSFFWDSHRYPWAHTATRSLFFGIHTDIPGRTQQPDLFSLGFTQISLGAHSNPISLFFLFFRDSHRYPWAHTATQSLFFFSFFSGFTQIFLGAHSIPISFLLDSHRYHWAHTATRSLSLFFFFFLFLGFTQISLGAHSIPISFLWDSHRYPWAHTATRSLFFGIHTDIPGRTQQPELF